jgi:Ca-activated chloride channel family protein
MSSFLGITWGAQGLLFYIPLLVLIVVVLVYRVRQRQDVVTRLAAPRFVSMLFNNYSVTRSRIKMVMSAVGFLFLFLTLLRPQWDIKEHTVAQQGRELFIALDISRSMLAQDVKPNRLARAKEKIKKLVSLFSCERVGLLLFSGSPFVQCPLTSDYAAFDLFLDAVDVETVSSGTTALDAAIHKIIQLFHAMPSKKNKLLVIFTDGEDFSSNLAGVKEQARKLGLHIFTIGVGTAQGAPIPIIDEHGNQRGVERDEKGAVVMSALNEGILNALAADTGGKYIRMSVDNDDDLASLARTVRSYEKEQFEDKKISNLQEQYPYFLAVSFLCFIIEWLL